MTESRPAQLTPPAGDNANLQRHFGFINPSDGSLEAAAWTNTKVSGTFKRFSMNLAMQEMAGPLQRSCGQMYKKKMWSFRSASEALPAALVKPATQRPGSSEISGGSGVNRGQAADGQTGNAHVAYCMMTFIIRNGIKQLKQSESVYKEYVAALVRRWGLPSEQSRRVKVLLCRFQNLAPASFCCVSRHNTR